MTFINEHLTLEDRDKYLADGGVLGIFPSERVIDYERDIVFFDLPYIAGAPGRRLELYFSDGTMERFIGYPDWKFVGEKEGGKVIKQLYDVHWQIRSYQGSDNPSNTIETLMELLEEALCVYGHGYR